MQQLTEAIFEPIEVEFERRITSTVLLDGFIESRTRGFHSLGVIGLETVQGFLVATVVLPLRQQLLRGGTAASGSVLCIGLVMS